MGVVQLRSCACFIRTKIPIFRNQASDTGSITHLSPIDMRQCDEHDDDDYDDYDDDDDDSDDYDDDDDADDDDLYDYMTHQYEATITRVPVIVNVVIIKSNTAEL